MSDVPVQLIVAAFQDEQGADEALKELKAAKKDHLIKIENAAVIRKDQKGKVHIKETEDMGGGKGAVIGGVVGAAIGVLTGGVGLALVGGGALVGGLAAKLRDGGFKDDRLKTLGNSLTPGSSAIVAVIDHQWVAEVEKEMQEVGAQVLTEAISADIAAQLGAGHEVAYSALSTDDALVTDRVAAGEDMTEISETVITDEGVEAVHVVETAAGVAAEHLAVTDDAAAYEAGAVTAESAAYVAAVTDGEDAVVLAAATEEDEGEAEESQGDETDSA